MDDIIIVTVTMATGSGGNNHALEHFQQTKYPLCVKLGTITPDGAGNHLPHVMSHDPPVTDVYSYDEDTMVEDPNLAQHLAHFGINVALMTKVCITSVGVMVTHVMT